jgi:hypothetical protein
MLLYRYLPSSSSGLGHFLFTEVTGIQIPLEVIKLISLSDFKLGITGFEPVTFCSQSRHATKLRYIPLINVIIAILSYIVKKKLNYNAIKIA